MGYIYEGPKYKIKKVEKWVLYEAARPEKELMILDDEAEALFHFQNINNIMLNVD